MPQYRFNVQDAQAIVAYLKSLEPGKYKILTTKSTKDHEGNPQRLRCCLCVPSR